MNKYISRVTSSARGERFNPLTYPFFLATFLYGVIFVGFAWNEGVANFSLFSIMASIHVWVPYAWGIVAILTIIMGATFLMFDKPPAGKASGLIGFMIWLFAVLCWATAGSWLLAITVAGPNAYFWFWQYLSLSFFRREDAEDKVTMDAYNRGEYDDEENPKDSRIARKANRGKDLQSEGSYDYPDDGKDTTRVLDTD